MQAFTLPAGCRMKLAASAEAGSRHRHRWAVELFAGGVSPNSADARLVYGSQIGHGESQTIEPPEQDVDCLCKVWSTHETVRGWEPDIAEVKLDTPDALTIAFRRPAAGGATDPTEECVLAFHFSPALKA